MTTQAELYKLAEKHSSNPAVMALLTSLMEAKAQLAQPMLSVRSSLGLVDLALAGTPDHFIAFSNTQLVTSAAEIAVALTRMAGDYFTLATVLQDLGEDISY